MAPSSASWPRASALDLDDLLDELRERVGTARRGHEQMLGLLDATVAVSSGLELEDVLSTVVRSACTLVGARYGALGVLGADRQHLVEFVTHGISDEERELIGPLPRGHGILGLLINDPRPRRISDIASHPDSSGFPPGHPPMGGFLGVPIRLREEVYGNLYLTEKEDGKEFTEEDEALLVALAAAAGVAIQNARLYQRTRVQQRWGEAVSDVTQTLLEGQTEAVALDLMTRSVCQGAAAAGCVIGLEQEGLPPAIAAIRPDGRQAEGGDGPGPEPWREDAEAWLSVLGIGQTVVLTPDEDEPVLRSVVTEVSEMVGLAAPGTTALVPFRAGADSLGLLMTVWQSSRDHPPAETLSSLEFFAEHIGLALMAARARHDRDLLTLLSDRERIARDMHDHVIQRLFATGLSLEAASRLAVHPEVRRRVTEGVDNLDLAIKDIRQAIYELHSPEVRSNFRDSLAGLLREFRLAAGFEGELDLRGDPRSVAPDLKLDALAVIREGLANITRHARASAATVSVTFGEDVEIVISDDGTGVAEGVRRSGLSNLSDRAAALGGTFELSGRHPRGTRLAWRAPQYGRSDAP